MTVAVTYEQSLLKPEKRVLSTLESDGSRRWMNPKLAHGRFLSRRRIVAYVLIFLFTAIPYIPINGKPAMLLDVMHRRFTFFGITFLPTDQDDLRVAQVRFDKTVTRGVAPPVRTRYISTLTVRYDKANIPSQIKDLHVNAFGFCAVNYRRDQEGVPQVLGAPAAPGSVGTAPVSSTSNAITPANVGMPQAATR